MANKFTSLADLKSHYGSANFVHTNVTGLTADPTVQTKDDGLSTSGANGTIQLLEAIFIRFDWQNQLYRNEIWRVEINVHYSGNLTTLREIVGEMDRLDNANNKSSTRTYEVEIKNMDDKDSKVNGKIELIIEYIKIDVSAPA